MTARSPRPTGSTRGENIMLPFLLGVLTPLACGGGGGGGSGDVLESSEYWTMYCNGVPIMDGTGGGSESCRLALDLLELSLNACPKLPLRLRKLVSDFFLLTTAGISSVLSVEKLGAGRFVKSSSGDSM